MDNGPIIKLRPYQEEVFWSVYRILFLLWRRQSGKSFTLGNRAARKMMEKVNHTIIMVSASILLGTEFIRKEAEVWRIVTNAFRARAKAAGMQLVTDADDDKGQLLDIDAIADLFEHQKLETRIYHSRTNFSRSRVVAPNPGTAVGWTGDIYMDEVGRVPALKEVIEAVEPFMDSNPEYEFLMATTPPPDESHYSFEAFLPPDQDFPTNPRGNWFTAPYGCPCHRLDAWDGDLAGAHYYSKKDGKQITPEEHRAESFDKIAWDRNHGVRFVSGGTAAVSLAAIQAAMARGQGRSLGLNVTDQLEVAA